MRRFFTKGRVALLAITVVLLFLNLYGFPVNLYTLQVPVQSVKASLSALGYEHCGTYTLGPEDGVITFSKVFEDDMSCFIIVNRPRGEYMFKEPKANLIIEPPSENTVYKYSVGIMFFQLINVLSIDETTKPFALWAAGVLNRTTRSPPLNELNAANDDLYVIFSYKPEKDGFPVNITLRVKAEVIEGRVPSPLETGIRNLARVIEMLQRGELARGATQPGPDLKEHIQKKLAVQLGIKEIKVFMSYLGYELCGEFTARETDELQKVELEVEIDLYNGKACYILIHPPPGRKAFLLVSSSWRTEFVGDEKQKWEYMSRAVKIEEIGGKYLLGTPFRLKSSYEALGLGRVFSKDDVERPYSSRIGLDVGSGGHHEFKDNAPMLIYFAYKGDPEVLKTFNERLQLWLKMHMAVEFRIIQAQYVVSVD